MLLSVRPKCKVYPCLPRYALNSGGSCPFGGDILTGEPPILMQNLSLKTSENALYRFGLPAVWSRGSMNMADNLIKEMAILQFLVASLIIMHQLVRLMT